MEACTFMFGINSRKTPQEAFEIANDMFALTMQGNNLKIASMYDESGKIKPADGSENRSWAFFRFGILLLWPFSKGK